MPPQNPPKCEPVRQGSKRHYKKVSLAQRGRNVPIRSFALQYQANGRKSCRWEALLLPIVTKNISLLYMFKDIATHQELLLYV